MKRVLAVLLFAATPAVADVWLRSVDKTYHGATCELRKLHMYATPAAFAERQGFKPHDCIDVATTVAELEPVPANIPTITAEVPRSVAASNNLRLPLGWVDFYDWQRAKNTKSEVIYLGIAPGDMLGSRSSSSSSSSYESARTERVSGYTRADGTVVDSYNRRPSGQAARDNQTSTSGYVRGNN